MFEKTFKILSNSQEYLTQEEIAEALLNYCTLSRKEPTIFFGVIECKDNNANLGCLASKE